MVTALPLREEGWLTLNGRALQIVLDAAQLGWFLAATGTARTALCTAWDCRAMAGARGGVAPVQLQHSPCHGAMPSVACGPGPRRR